MSFDNFNITSQHLQSLNEQYDLNGRVKQAHYVLYTGFQRQHPNGSTIWHWWPWQRKSLTGWSDYFFPTGYNSPRKQSFNALWQNYQGFHWLRRCWYRWVYRYTTLPLVRTWMIQKLLQNYQGDPMSARTMIELAAQHKEPAPVVDDHYGFRGYVQDAKALSELVMLHTELAYATKQELLDSLCQSILEKLERVMRRLLPSSFRFFSSTPRPTNSVQIEQAYQAATQEIEKTRQVCLTQRQPLTVSTNPSSSDDNDVSHETMEPVTHHTKPPVLEFPKLTPLRFTDLQMMKQQFEQDMERVKAWKQYWKTRSGCIDEQTLASQFETSLQSARKYLKLLTKRYHPDGYLGDDALLAQATTFCTQLIEEMHAFLEIETVSDLLQPCSTNFPSEAFPSGDNLTPYLQKMLNDYIEKMNEKMNAYLAKLRKSEKRLDDLKQQLKDSGQQLKDSGQQLKDSGQQLKDSGQQLKDSGQQLKDSGQQSPSLSASLAKLEQQGKTHDQQIANLKACIKQVLEQRRQQEPSVAAASEQSRDASATACQEGETVTTTARHSLFATATLRKFDGTITTSNDNLNPQATLL